VYVLPEAHGMSGTMLPFDVSLPAINYKRVNKQVEGILS